MSTEEREGPDRGHFPLPDHRQGPYEVDPTTWGTVSLVLRKGDGGHDHTRFPFEFQPPTGRKLMDADWAGQENRPIGVAAIIDLEGFEPSRNGGTLHWRLNTWPDTDEVRNAFSDPLGPEDPAEWRAANKNGPESPLEFVRAALPVLAGGPMYVGARYVATLMYFDQQEHPEILGEGTASAGLGRLRVEAIEQQKVWRDENPWKTMWRDEGRKLRDRLGTEEDIAWSQEHPRLAGVRNWLFADAKPVPFGARPPLVEHDADFWATFVRSLQIQNLTLARMRQRGEMAEALDRAMARIRRDNVNVRRAIVFQGGSISARTMMAPIRDRSAAEAHGWGGARTMCVMLGGELAPVQTFADMLEPAEPEASAPEVSEEAPPAAPLTIVPLEDTGEDEEAVAHDFGTVPATAVVPDTADSPLPPRDATVQLMEEAFWTRWTRGRPKPSES